MRKLVILLFFLSVSNSLFCQTKTDVLLTIDNREVTTEEFLRIYNKNSSIETEENKSIDEYLDLFINYKLKVIEAENLGYDTLNSFITEMGGYKEQLSKPYLENNELIDSIVRLEYARSLEEVEVSHILINSRENAAPQDTLAAYNKAISIRKRLLAGEPFDEVAKATSEDPSVKMNGGHLGYFTAFQMVYPFEDASFNAPLGSITMPVRTKYGYHIIMVHNKRQARGEVMTSHIMTIFPRNASDLEKETAKQKIDKAYTELKEGKSWDETVQAYSEHKATLKNNGSMGWVKAGIVPDEFIDVCFSLDSGTYSEPFISPFGFHIVKVFGIKPVPSFDEQKEAFESKIRSASIFEKISEEQLVAKLKRENGFAFYPENLQSIYSLADSSIYNGLFTFTDNGSLTKPVFTIGAKVFSQADVANSIANEKGANPKTIPIQSIIDKKIDLLIDNEVIAYEKARLPEKYPDLKNLLAEYHDGILLFNLTEDKVWKKAVEDTAGLKLFYNQIPSKYSWKERVQLVKYVYSDSTLITPLLKAAKTRIKKGGTAAEISTKLCPTDTIPCIELTDLKYERGDNSISDSISWKPGSYLTSKAKNKFVLYYVEKTLPSQEKKLEDAKGLYTADYQTHLEKLWIDSLRIKYTIEVNKEVLEKLKRNTNTTPVAN